MNEESYWPALEYRVSREMSESREWASRGLWCDGFLAEGVDVEAHRCQVWGRTWIGLGPRTQEEWTFDLLVPQRVESREDIAWSDLLPPEGISSWLLIDLERRHLTLDPARAMRFFVAESYRLTLINEDCYKPRSVDNIRTYSNEYVLGDGRPSSTHGVWCQQGEKILGSAVLLAGGGASGVHEHSMLALDSRVFVAVGDQVASLDLPALGLRWNVRADEATVFGLHATPDREALIVHGELQVSRLTSDGDIVWSAGGADIFTGELRVEGDRISVHDFEGQEYHFETLSGRHLAT